MNVLIAVSLGAVLVSLGLGLFSLARGGEFARANSNRFMRWRVMTQAVAIVLLTIGMIWKMSR